MTKPTPITMRNPKVEISTDGGATWTDISGFFAAVSPDGGEWQTSEDYVATDDTPMIGAGKRSAFTVPLNIVYTEGASDAAALLYDAWRNQTPTQLRYSPRGGATGQNMVTFNPGIVTKAPLPGGEVKSTDPIHIEASIITDDYTISTIA